MMNEIFDLGPKYTATYTRSVDTDTAGVLSSSISAVGSADAVFYRGGQAERFVSSQFKPEVSGVILHKPNLSFTILAGDLVTINGLNFQVVYPDNIGCEVLAVAVKNK